VGARLTMLSRPSGSVCQPVLVLNSVSSMTVLTRGLGAGTVAADGPLRSIPPAENVSVLPPFQLPDHELFSAKVPSASTPI